MRLSTVTYPLLALNFALSHAKLVQKTLELTWAKGSPNGGQERDMVFTNGDFPGPDLVFDEDDVVEVLVTNKLPFNTTVHWHGVEMRETPWSDGVPGLSQSPIGPGDTYLYRFRAYPAGTYWYHSHYKGVMQDGQIGAMYIRRKSDAPRPYSAITQDPNELKQMKVAEDNPNLVLVTDWTYLTSEEYHQVSLDSGYNVFCVDGLIVNGHGSVWCPGYQYLESVSDPGIQAVLEGSNLTEKGCLQPDLYNVQGDWGNWNLSAVPGPVVWNCTESTSETPVITVNPEKNGWASLNFVNASPQKGITVSVDNHPMWVYEVDGQLVEPREVEIIAIYSGARYSAMIKLNQQPGDYAIRISVDGGDQVISTYAYLSYANQDKSNANNPPFKASIGPRTQGYMNYGGQNTTADVRKLLFTENLPPFGVPPPPPSSEVSTTLRTAMTRVGHSWAWSLANHVLYETEMTDSTPLLFESDPLKTISPKFVFTTKNNTWVDIVLEIEASEHDPIHPPHPIHKHGNRAYIIGTGTGKFKWENVSQAEAEKPEFFFIDKRAALRDTFVTNFFDSRESQGAWIVVRYFVTGKMASLLHCHISSHQLAGMSLALLDGIDIWGSEDCWHRED